ncbi:hypothetical protein N658DRAFT_481858 [Parathielavia hyrcaniae]|uniref:Secreted protein n=1 Tax=Parathielavia hyrcaniae TaxID=113614 RepID=A0AAN6SW99_9PEZI|nr:hypothetical protein N658DRAFT_481858 [Parathielavia hyrcaniae]
MAPWARIFWAYWLTIEISHALLRSPTFHHGVRRIHRTVQDIRYGRNPHEPLRQGEATAEPSKTQSFLKYFIEELRNQARGKPTNPPPTKLPPKT